MSTFTLGPLQEKWLQELESGRHEQGNRRLCATYLSELPDEKGNLRAFKRYCCLGVAAEFVLNIQPFSSEREDDVFSFDKSSEVLKRYDEIGLRDNMGYLQESFVHNGEELLSLAEMNDEGLTFTEIAAYIRENPENVFTKSC